MRSVVYAVVPSVDSTGPRSGRSPVSASVARTDAVATTAAASVPGPLDGIDLSDLAKRHKADPADALAWWRETYPLERRRKFLKALTVVTLMPGQRGRPLGVAAGGLDPASVRNDWTANY